MSDTSNDSPPEDRRSFLSWVSSGAMIGGLLAGYGAMAAMMGRFLYPSRKPQAAWIYVTRVDQLKVGEAMRYQTPAGQGVTITRRKENGTADDFLALSSICPHLGCQVHWEPQNRRFFCPCHNGVFNPEGKATAGPPADAGQSLSPYPLRVDNGLLFIEVPV